MSTKAGVWIDHKQAIVVLVTEAGQEVKKIAFDAGQPTKASGSSRGRNRFTPNDFVAEDRQERKLENDRKKYYDEVLAAIREATSILILGPGEAKAEFGKRIKSKKLRGVTMQAETADKMTERQLTAKVRAHFAEGAASKSAAAKKPEKVKTAKSVKTKTTKAATGKGPKKAKK